MNNELVILTHQYPHAMGDAAFVESEIWSLAERFDRVVVWTLAPSKGPLVLMPSNVEFAGSLLTHSVSSPTLFLSALTRLPAVVRLLVRELRSRGRTVKLGRLVRSAAVVVVGGHRFGLWLRARSVSGTTPVVYSFWGTDCAMTLLSSEVAVERVVVRMHGYDLYEHRVGYLPFRRELFDRADKLLTVSQHGADYLARTYDGEGVLPAVVVARLGTQDRGTGRGATRDTVRIVSCSSLIPLKRVGMIFDVVNALAVDRQVQWTHFGDGPSRSDLERQIAGKSENLTVELRGTVSRDVIFEYYAQTPISAFINLSTTEGLPVSIMEAMSFGIPIVATDVGGSGELVGGIHQSGLLVSSAGELLECVNALRSVVDHPDQWDSRRTWAEMCDAKKNGDVVATLLDDGATCEN